MVHGPVITFSNMILPHSCAHSLCMLAFSLLEAGYFLRGGFVLSHSQTDKVACTWWPLHLVQIFRITIIWHHTHFRSPSALPTHFTKIIVAQNPNFVKLHVALYRKMIIRQGHHFAHVTTTIRHRDISRFVTWLTNQNDTYNKKKFHKISVMSS